MDAVQSMSPRVKDGHREIEQPLHENSNNDSDGSIGEPLVLDAFDGDDVDDNADGDIDR